MKIDILTLFPKMFSGPFQESIVKRAQEKGLVEIEIHNLRNWTKDKHKTVDDRPFGGGKGMILMIKPIDEALKELKESSINTNKQKVMLLSPQGKKFNQKKANKLVKLDQLILVCGHYEGVDERVRQNLIDEELSIGDYILTGGELPAMVVTDSVVRLISGVLPKGVTAAESFSENKLDFPQYTRPANYQGWKVPQVLLSGNHEKIKNWRQQKALERTKKRRPDLLK